MKFSVRVPSAEIRQKLRAAKAAFGNQQRPVLEALGVRVLSYARQDYVTKSRGGRGTDGISWAALAPATIKARNRRGKANAKRKTTKSGKSRAFGGSVAIGIDTGLQLNSSSPGFVAAGGGNVFRLTNTDITVGFGRTYSEFFNAKRPLLPDRLPDVWRKELEAIVERWGEELLRETLGGI